MAQRVVAASAIAMSLSWVSSCGAFTDSLESSSTPSGALLASYDFTVATLPDTQSYAKEYPEVFIQQTQWIVDNASEERIVFVSHLGDIVHNGASTVQWSNARAAMDLLLQADIPHGVCLGNHDKNDPGGYHNTSSPAGCSATPAEACVGRMYIESFGPLRFADRPWYGGASSSALSNYQVVTVGDQELLFLHLVVDPWDEEIAWAQGVLDRHPKAAVAVSTHRYLLDYRITRDMPEPLPLLSAKRFDAFTVQFVQDLYFENGWIAEDVFRRFVSRNPQIYLVQCGHVDAEYYQVSQNVAGLPVYEVLADFQSVPPQGGNGWLRLLRYDVSGSKIHIQTYSPTLDRFRRNAEGCAFSLDLLTKYAEAQRDLIEEVADYALLQELLDRWQNTSAGREEFCALLYDDGWRDSSFTIDVDFAAYRID